MKETTTAEPQRTRITVKPPIIPGEFEDHPDTKRLDWILKHLRFVMILADKMVYPTSLIKDLEDAWQSEADDPRDIIDRAMEGEDE
jgi:hypothetical protein